MTPVCLRGAFQVSESDLPLPGRLDTVTLTPQSTLNKMGAIECLMDCSKNGASHLVRKTSVPRCFVPRLGQSLLRSFAIGVVSLFLIQIYCAVNYNKTFVDQYFRILFAAILQIS